MQIWQISPYIPCFPSFLMGQNMWLNALKSCDRMWSKLRNSSFSNGLPKFLEMLLAALQMTMFLILKMTIASMIIPNCKRKTNFKERLRSHRSRMRSEAGITYNRNESRTRHRVAVKIFYHCNQRRGGREICRLNLVVVIGGGKRKNKKTY